MKRINDDWTMSAESFFEHLKEDVDRSAATGIAHHPAAQFWMPMHEHSVLHSRIKSRDASIPSRIPPSVQCLATVRE